MKIGDTAALGRIGGRVTTVAAIPVLGLVTICAPLRVEAEEQTPPSTDGDAQTIEAGDEAQVEEVVVYGRRRDARLSIDSKRDSDQIGDVLTAHEASRLPDNNMAEMLGRLPGISFRRSGETGDGNYIAIRGMDSALNTVSFDGVKSGLGGFGGRRVPLDGISTEDVAELQVVKSLLPRDAGQGIGGTVRVTSRTPLDYEEDGLRVSLEGRYGEFSEEWGNRSRLSFNRRFGEDFGISLSASVRHRQLRNFELDGTSSNLLFLPPIVDAAGNPVDNELVEDELDDPGSSFDNVTAGFFHPDVITFEEHTYEVQDQERDTTSLSGAVEWRIDERTRLVLGGRLNRQEASATENSIAFDNDDDDFEEIDGVLYTIFDDPEIDFESQIEDETLVNGSLYLKGTTELDRLGLTYQVSYATAETSAPETDIDFDTGSLLDDDTVTFVPFSYTGTYFPVPHASVADDDDFVEAINDIPGTQILDDFTMVPTNKRVNDRLGFKIDAEYRPDIELLSGAVSSIDAGFEFERSEIAEGTTVLVYFDADALNLDGTFDPDYEGSGDGEELESFEGLFGGFVSLDPVGGPLRPIGLHGIPILNEAAFRRLARTFRDSFLASGEDPYDEFFFDVEEDLLAGYVQAEVTLERLSLVGGVRIEHYRGAYASPLAFSAGLETVNLGDPTDEDSAYDETIDLRAGGTSEIIRTEAERTEVLPRMNLTYLIADNLQLRAGAGYSLARPSFNQLGRATSIELGLEAEADEVGDTPVLPGVTTAAGAVAGGLTLDQLTEVDIVVESGNPGLDNARSRNIDLSLEYFPMRGTAVTLGLFDKHIENFLFVGSEPVGGGLDLELVASLLSPDGRTLIDQLGGLDALIASDVVDDLEVLQPRNGGDAEVSGIELAVLHEFSWAPGWLSRTGLSFSVAYTDSEAEIAVVESATPANPDGGLEDDEALVVLGFADEGDGVHRRTDFFNSPGWSANLSLYYESDDFEIALSSQHQSTSFDSLDDFGLDQYSGRYSQWDLYVEYGLPDSLGLGDVSIYLEVPDLTDTGRNPTDLQSLSRRRQVIDEVSFNGREFRIGVRGRF